LREQLLGCWRKRYWDKCSKPRGYNRRL